MKHYAGIDLSMETSHLCVVNAEGRKVGASCVDSTPEAIAAVLNRHGPVERAVIERGRMTPFVALGLRDFGVGIVCIDAREAHHSLKAMKANKTDPHDAAGLPQLARTGFYKEVHIKSPAADGVRSVITARGQLVEARVRLDNTIRGLAATRDGAATAVKGSTLLRFSGISSPGSSPSRDGPVGVPEDCNQPLDIDRKKTRLDWVAFNRPSFEAPRLTEKSPRLPDR